MNGTEKEIPHYEASSTPHFYPSRVQQISALVAYIPYSKNSNLYLSNINCIHIQFI